MHCPKCGQTAWTGSERLCEPPRVCERSGNIFATFCKGCRDLFRGERMRKNLEESGRVVWQCVQKVDVPWYRTLVISRIFAWLVTVHGAVGHSTQSKMRLCYKLMWKLKAILCQPVVLNTSGRRQTCDPIAITQIWQASRTYYGSLISTMLSRLAAPEVFFRVRSRMARLDGSEVQGRGKLFLFVLGHLCHPFASRFSSFQRQKNERGS